MCGGIVLSEWCCTVSVGKWACKRTSREKEVG